MPAARRNPEQREHDRDEIERCLVRNLNRRAITAKLDLTASQVAAHVREIKSDWRQAAEATPAEVRASVLARLRQLELAAWAEWERSCSTRTRRKTARRTAGGKAAGATEAAELATEDRVGDPRFLAEIRANLAQQAALQGAKQSTSEQRESTVQRLSMLEVSAIRTRDRLEAKVFEQMGFYAAPIAEGEYEQIESGEATQMPRLIVVRSRAELERLQEVCGANGIPLAGEVAPTVAQSPTPAPSPETCDDGMAAKTEPPPSAADPGVKTGRRRRPRWNSGADSAKIRCE